MVFLSWGERGSECVSPETIDPSKNFSPPNISLAFPKPDSQHIQMAKEIANQKPPELSGDIVIFDESIPNSLINIVPPRIKECIQNAYKSDPHLFNMDETDLFSYLGSKYRKPSPTENRLRLKFWFEFDRVQESWVADAKSKWENEINISRVISNICSRDFFYSSYIIHPSKLAWLLCIPASYQNKAEEALEFSFEQVRDILSQSHILYHPNDINKLNPQVDVQFATLKFKIFEALANRVKGAVVQRTENKSVSMNMNTSDRKLIREMATSMSETDLIEKIKELERMERKSLHLPDVVQIENPIVDVILPGEKVK